VRAVIVLPTYNERDNVEPFLRAVRAVSDIDVLVVDDNSPDGTADLVRELGSELGGVEAYDVVVSMDADLSHDPAVLPAMLALIDEGADTVIGSRYVRGGGTTDWPVRRQLLSKWGNAYTRRLLRLTPHDCTSGYRAYRASALAAIDPYDTSAEGYAFLTELVRRLTRHGYRIVETPIVFRDRTQGKSKMSGRIIAESMLLVTKWGLIDRLRPRRRSPRV